MTDFVEAFKAMYEGKRIRRGECKMWSWFDERQGNWIREDGLYLSLIPEDIKATDWEVEEDVR